MTYDEDLSYFFQKPTRVTMPLLVKKSLSNVVFHFTVYLNVEKI